MQCKIDLLRPSPFSLGVAKTFGLQGGGGGVCKDNDESVLIYDFQMLAGMLIVYIVLKNS